MGADRHQNEHFGPGRAPAIARVVGLRFLAGRTRIGDQRVMVIQGLKHPGRALQDPHWFATPLDAEGLRLVMSTTHPPRRSRVPADWETSWR